MLRTTLVPERSDSELKSNVAHNQGLVKELDKKLAAVREGGSAGASLAGSSNA